MKKLVLFLSLAVSVSVFGTTKTSVSTGLWTDPNIWSPAGVPSITDDTVIISSYVSFSAINVTCAASYLEILNNASLAGGAGSCSFTFTGDVFINNGDIVGHTLVLNATDSVVNNGPIGIKYLMQTGLFINREIICVDFDLSTAGNVINNSEIGCGNWTNNATVTGSMGRFCISQGFSNYGAISGTLDICDASPSGAGDNNTGTISGSVTYCAVGLCYCSTVGVEEHAVSADILIAPNPVSTVALITLKTHQLPSTQLVFTVTDVQGRVVKTVPFSGNTLLFDRAGIESGMYFYSVILPDDSVVSGKMLID